MKTLNHNDLRLRFAENVRSLISRKILIVGTREIRYQVRNKFYNNKTLVVKDEIRRIMYQTINGNIYDNSKN
jgi:hypothetical protein